MSDLANKKCIPCEGNIPPFEIEEIHNYLKKVDGWSVKEDVVDGYHLQKDFKFENFLILLAIQKHAIYNKFNWRA